MGVPTLGSTKTVDELENIFEVISIVHAHYDIVLSPRAGPPYSIRVEDVPITKDGLVGNVLPSKGDGVDHPHGGEGHHRGMCKQLIRLWGLGQVRVG